MYSITLDWFIRDENGNPAKYCTRTISGDTLKECMAEVRAFKDHHDLWANTHAEIVDVTEE